MVSQHLIQNNLLSDDQLGFCPGKSIVTALILSFHNILKSLELSSGVGLVFFDLRKAFDSVPHLPGYGILASIATYFNRLRIIIVEDNM